MKLYKNNKTLNRRRRLVGKINKERQAEQWVMHLIITEQRLRHPRVCFAFSYPCPDATADDRYGDEKDGTSDGDDVALTGFYLIKHQRVVEKDKRSLRVPKKKKGTKLS